MEHAIDAYDLETIKKLVNEASDDNDGKDVVNAAFEKEVRSKAMKMIKSNVSIDEIEKFFLFVVEVAKSGLCAKNLSVAVMQDMLECSKKSRCADIFTIVENHIRVWKTPEFFEQCKNNVLRMCNDLLKRLSRTIDTQFCGRINILLARSLPLNEKSGLNPTGQFNAMNETEYDLEVDESELKAGTKEQTEDVDIDSTPEIPVDFKLYQQFWELQKYFSDPNKIYHNNSFDVFQKNLNEVLIVFTTYKLDKRRIDISHHHENIMEGIEEAAKRPDVFFAKYQTSQKLLHLQFADPQFRRYFLLQCLILANYLQSDVRFRDDALFLNEEQNKYITDMTEKCYKLLRDTFPRGYYFADFVKKLLSREKIWSTWKNEGCIDWLASRPERTLKFVRRIKLPTYEPEKVDLGNETLNKLWSLSTDNLSACRNPKRNFVPKLEDVISESLDHADPEQGVEAEYSCFNNEVWQWKNSRLFLTQGENYLSIQSCPPARKPCLDYSEVLKSGVFSIAESSKDETIREKGKAVAQRTNDYRIKKEADDKKNEEEARQKAEEEAKRKAMEAAAERKKKDEESAAQRAKALAEMEAKKPNKKDEESSSQKDNAKELLDDSNSNSNHSSRKSKRRSASVVKEEVQAKKAKVDGNLKHPKSYHVDVSSENKPGGEESACSTSSQALDSAGTTGYQDTTVKAMLPSRERLVKPTWHAPWKLHRVTSGHTGWVRCVDVEPENKWFVTGGADRLIKTWDLESGQLRQTLTGHASAVRAVKISDRHPYLFSGGEDKQVKCWDVEYNKVVRHYHGHLGAVQSLALHPTLDVLVSTSRDSTARVWDIRTKAEINCLTGHTNTVATVVCQKTDPQIITGSHDSTIRLWDLSTGKSVHTLTHHKKSVRALAMHPLVNMFCSASSDSIRQWRCPNGDFSAKLIGHSTPINALAINEDGVTVSGADNGTMCLYDWKSRFCFQKLHEAAQPGSIDSERGIYALTFDKSGTRLISAEADKSIKLFKEDPDATEETHPILWRPELLKKHRA